jgi:hypothetical protein
MKHNVTLRNNTFTKYMVNYFSIGKDARISLGFEKTRKSKRMFNNLVYAYEILKKAFLKNHRLSYLIKSISEIDDMPGEDISAR